MVVRPSAAVDSSAGILHTVEHTLSEVGLIEIARRPSSFTILRIHTTNPSDMESPGVTPLPNHVALDESPGANTTTIEASAFTTSLDVKVPAEEGGIELAPTAISSAKREDGA